MASASSAMPAGNRPLVLYKGSLSRLEPGTPAARYEQTVIVQSDEPFTLEPATVKQGQKRLHALLLKPFPVLKLSFKIRQKIWTYVAKAEQPFFFTSEKPFGRPPQSLRKRQGGSARQGLALALVSKQLENEAIPIIYSVNTFVFDQASAMDTFFRRYSSMRRYIEHVRVTDVYGTRFVYEHTLWTLWPMMETRSMTFDWCCVDGWPEWDTRLKRHSHSLENFFNQIKFFLCKWHNANKNRGNAASALDLIQLVGDGPGKYLVATKLRSMIAQDLGISLQGGSSTQRATPHTNKHHKGASGVLDVLKLVRRKFERCHVCAHELEPCDPYSEATCKLRRENRECAVRISTEYKLQKLIAQDLGRFLKGATFALANQSLATDTMRTSASYDVRVASTR